MQPFTSILCFLTPLVLPPTNAAICTWPKADVLFVLDSTVNVGGMANHKRILTFVDHLIGNMRVSADATHISLVQFTPEMKTEFGFIYDAISQLQSRVNVSQCVPRNA